MKNNDLNNAIVSYNNIQILLKEYCRLSFSMVGRVPQLQHRAALALAGEIIPSCIISIAVVLQS
jgi:hypothetical protein